MNNSASPLKPLKKIAKSLLPERALRLRLRRRWHAMASKHGLTLSFRQDFSELSRGLKVLRIGAHHGIYIPHMSESFDYYFNSVLPVQQGKYSVVDLSGPRYHRLIGFDELPLMFPSHSEPYVTTSQYLDFAGLGEGKVVLDIGAYAGVTSIIFARLVGASGKVFALEADRNNIACAKENILLAARWFDLHNIELIDSAVWSHTGVLEFSTEGAMGSSAVSIVGTGRGPAIKVPCTTIGDFCTSRAITRVDFIKMDIEGAEIEVLKASQDVLSQLKPRLIIEPHYVDGVMSTDRCRDILLGCGYRVDVISQTGLSTPLIEATQR
jgi:FkbM family methyltransferase